VQVDPIKTKLKPPGTKLLKLNCDLLLSTFAFKLNLCRYTMAYEVAASAAAGRAAAAAARNAARTQVVSVSASAEHLRVSLDSLDGIGGRGLHSSIFSAPPEPFLPQNTP